MNHSSICNFVRRSVHAATLLAGAALAAACGGGGGDSGSQPTATSYSQDDIKSVAALGALSTVITGDRSVTAFSYLSGVMVGQSIVNSGTVSSGTLSCVQNGSGSGTLSRTVTKSAVRTGLAIGDKVTMTYANCSSVTDSYVTNGIVTLTAVSAANNLNFGSYDTRFTADMSGFSVRNGTVTTSFSGSASVVVTVSGNASTVRFTVPTGNTLSTEASGLTLTYASGATFLMSDGVTAGASTRKLDGTLLASVSSARFNVVGMTLTTTKDLTGSSSTQPFVPTAGSQTLNASSVSTRNVSLTATSTFSGSNVSISADSDGNGTMDTSFNTSWTSLLAS